MAGERVKRELNVKAAKAASAGREAEGKRIAAEGSAFPLVSPNDLRRTFATWCALAGMRPASIALLLGHRDSRMVERVYSVLRTRDLGRDLAGVFDGLQLPSVPVPGNTWVTDTSTQGRQMRQVRPKTKTASPSEKPSASVPRAGIEPATRGFSVLCSTN